MTCKDCIHYDICYFYNETSRYDLNSAELKCEHFKNKADFVEVVRCKDCVYFENGQNFHNECRRLDGLSSPSDNDYCSYGERK